MRRWIVSLTFLLVVLGIISTTSPSYVNANIDEVKLINPKNKMVTANNLVLISGKGQQGTSIKIDTYLANLLRNQKVDLNNPPKGGYVLVESEDIKIGASGSFARELSLSDGLNRIEIEVEDTDEPQIRYVYVTDSNKAHAELENINDIKFTGSLKLLIK